MADLSSLGSDTSGIWTRAQALSLMTTGQVRAVLRDGVWQTVLPGIYADAGIALDAEQRAFAAVLASGGVRGQPSKAKDRHLWRAVAAGRTAARVWGFPLIDDDDPATGAHESVIDDVAVRTGRVTRITHVAELDPGPPRELRRRRLTLAPLDVSRRPSGLLLTSPLRTLFDCAALLTHEALVCLLDDALQRKLLTLGQLTTYAVEHRWNVGAPAFRRALSLSDGRAESPLETLVRLLVLPTLPQLRPQIELYDEAVRLVARFDLGDEAARFAIEGDGRAGHAGSDMVAKDRRRDRRTVRCGWATERVTWFEVRRERRQTLHRLVTRHAEQVAVAVAAAAVAPAS